MNRYIRAVGLPIVSHFRARRHARNNGLRLTRSNDFYEFSKGDQAVRIATSQIKYAQTIAEQFAIYAGAVLPDLIDGREVVDFSRPRWHVLSKSKAPVFLNSFSEGDDLVTDYLAGTNVRPGSNVLDFGANCGLLTVFLAKAVGASGRVVAVEADPRNFRALEQNISTNQFGNILPLRAAVWTSDGTVRFNADGTMGAAIADSGGVTVRTRTLESIMADAAMDHVDFIKMDIEGAEMTILPNAGPFLDKHRAQWAIEVHDKVNGLSIIKKLFEKHRYAVLTITEFPAPVLSCRPL